MLPLLDNKPTKLFFYEKNSDLRTNGSFFKHFFKLYRAKINREGNVIKEKRQEYVRALYPQGFNH